MGTDRASGAGEGLKPMTRLLLLAVALGQSVHLSGTSSTEQPVEQPQPTAQRTRATADRKAERGAPRL